MTQSNQLKDMLRVFGNALYEMMDVKKNDFIKDLGVESAETCLSRRGVDLSDMFCGEDDAYEEVTEGHYKNAVASGKLIFWLEMLYEDSALRSHMLQEMSQVMEKYMLELNNSINETAKVLGSEIKENFAEATHQERYMALKASKPANIILKPYEAAMAFRKSKENISGMYGEVIKIDIVDEKAVISLVGVDWESDLGQIYYYDILEGIYHMWDFKSRFTEEFVQSIKESDKLFLIYKAKNSDSLRKPQPPAKGDRIKPFFGTNPNGESYYDYDDPEQYGGRSYDNE